MSDGPVMEGVSLREPTYPPMENRKIIDSKVPASRGYVSSLEDNFQHENHSSTAVDSISPKIPSGYPDDLAKGLEYLSDFLLDKKLISSST